MSALPIYFFLPCSEAQFNRLPTSLGAYSEWQASERELNPYTGRYHWVLQTYLHLLEAGQDARLVRSMPSEGIVLAHIETLAYGQRPTRELLVVPMLVDKNVPLPGAEREVQQLATLFARHSVFVQREATKTRFKETANSASLLHVAAHAEVDEVDPMFSHILFSSGPQDTGLLEAREIFQLNLGGVKLVTLSACESGLGKVSRGEEIVGFTRSFLSAGADSVIASLWPVADDSTEALMTKLYQELAAGRDLGSAMQAAQIDVLRNRRFAHPFFWAPFYVIGNGQLRLAP